MLMCISHNNNNNINDNDSLDLYSVSHKTRGRFTQFDECDKNKYIATRMSVCRGEAELIEVLGRSKRLLFEEFLNMYRDEVLRMSAWTAFPKGWLATLKYIPVQSCFHARQTCLLCFPSTVYQQCWCQRMCSVVEEAKSVAGVQG